MDRNIVLRPGSGAGGSFATNEQGGRGRTRDAEGGDGVVERGDVEASPLGREAVPLPSDSRTRWKRAGSSASLFRRHARASGTHRPRAEIKNAAAITRDARGARRARGVQRTLALEGPLVAPKE